MPSFSRFLVIFLCPMVIVLNANMMINAAPINSAAANSNPAQLDMYAALPANQQLELASLMSGFSEVSPSAAASLAKRGIFADTISLISNPSLGSVEAVVKDLLSSFGSSSSFSSISPSRLANAKAKLNSISKGNSVTATLPLAAGANKVLDLPLRRRHNQLEKRDTLSTVVNILNSIQSSSLLQKAASLLSDISNGSGVIAEVKDGAGVLTAVTPIIEGVISGSSSDSTAASTSGSSP